jgi:AbrB family looped-hinge helix DNA binding protein
MNGTHVVTMGDRGRLVVPLAVRERVGLNEGTPIVIVETEAGLVLLTRQQLRARVKDELAGIDLVGQLLTERRAAAAAEDLA